MSISSSGRANARARSFVLVGFVVVAALSRLIPHAPNFTAVGALALFGGATFTSRRSAYLVPLGAMLLSDLALEAIAGIGFHALLPVVYGCFALTTLLGRGLQGKVRVESVAWRSFAGALLFFVVTNFAVWLRASPGAATWSGLGQCYVAALPFFGNSLAGFAFWGVALFGGLELAERRIPALARVRS